MLFRPPDFIEAEVFAELPASYRKRGVVAPWAAARRGGKPIDSFFEGPSFDREGNLYVTDIPFGRIFRIAPNGAFALVAEYDGEPNGLRIAKDGRILITDYKNGIVELDPARGAVTPFLERRYSERFKRSLLRSTLPAAAALTVGPFVSRARGAEFGFKAATNLVATHPTNVRLKEAAERILKELDGRLEIQVFPNSQLGGEAALLSQVRSGAVEIFMIGGLVVSSMVPITAINGVGFAFSNYDLVWTAMDGKLGAMVLEGIAKAGLYAPRRPWDLGFRQITSSVRPINSVDDLQGMKIRVPGSVAYTSVFKALGASPVSLQFPEVYSALQTKVVDGQENPLALISTSKFYEVQKYCSITNHVWDGFWCLVNIGAWRSLPSSLQEIAERNINSSGLQQRDDLAKLDLSLRDELKAAGLVMNTPASDSFRSKLVLSGYYADARSRYGEQAWALLEEAAGKLS